MPVQSPPSESNQSTASGAAQAPGAGGGAGVAITQELVEKLADRVYTQLLLDLKVERERGRWLSKSARIVGGR